MSNPQIQVDVKLNDSDYQKGAAGIQKSAKQMAQDFQKLGREISQVSQTMVFFGGAVTASVGAAFAKASKDLPVVDQQLKEIGNSFQALADNVALAAAPSLEAFAKLVNGMVYTVSKFVAEHQQLVNQFIQYSAIALAVGTLGFALAKLWAAMANLWKIGIQLGAVISGLSLATVGWTAVILAAVAALVILDKAMGGYWADQFSKTLTNLKKTFQGFIDDFRIGTERTTKRATDLWGQFFQGFKDNLNTMAVNVKNFGAGVSASMEKAFGDTIFNTIKGNFKDLKSVIMSFADDVLRAFSRMAANQFLAMLFGNKDGGTGIFSSLGSMLGFQGKSPVKETTKQFEDLTQNMKYFGREKDKVIDKLKDFGKGLQKALPDAAKGASVAGAAGAGGALAINIGSFTGAAQAAEGLNAMLAGTVGFVAAIGAGFDMVGLKIIKMGVIYAATTAAMLAVSIGAAVAQVAIGVATAAALSAAYIVPALLASIMTFGAAAAVGTAAVGAALAGAGGMIALGNASAGGGLPAGAGISFGDGAFAKGAEGGIVTRPTFALIGEAGPEAVVPLNKTPGSSPLGGKMGTTRVDINIGTAMLNNPSNMKDFVRILKEELAR